jgi:hypothetical protein
VTVTGQDIVTSARKLLGVYYEWWSEGEPIPLWYYDYPNGVPPRWWFDENGTMCSDLVNFALMDNGLEYVGGTPAFYDYLIASGVAEDFDPDTPGEPGAVCVNPGIWRGGTGQGHIAIYTDEHTLIQATDGAGDYAGVNEWEQDGSSHQWAGYWIYGRLPGVAYGEGVVDIPVVGPRWISIDKDGWLRADGPDWSRGWYGISDDGKLSSWKGPGEA